MGLSILDMNRFFLDSHLFSDDRVKFPEDIAHQIINVLRMRSGDEVIVLDDQGISYRVELMVDLEQKTVSGKIVSEEPVTTEPKVTLALCFGMTSRDKVEMILQKGTEIGVSDFFPFISSRTLVQSTDLSEKKKIRWERIIREAAEQSHRGRMPVLAAPKSYEECISAICDQYDLSLIAWEDAKREGTKLKDIVESFHGSTIALVVGPEGGFSEEEIDSAKKAGCQVVSLGERILRMETAAMVFPALVFYELGEL